MLLNVSGNRFGRDSIMDIWNIHTASLTPILLWRTKMNQFRVVQHGQLSTVLINVDYVLFDVKYKTLLDKISNQLNQKPVTIFDEVRQLTWDNFIEVEILNRIQYSQAHKVDSSGFKIWKYLNQYVFVSPDLKNDLEQVGDSNLNFALGFSYFAGTETRSC